MISGNPDKIFESDDLVKSWFDQGSIVFENYYLINQKTTKKEAIEKLNTASVIFLCGGYPAKQNAFLNEYQLTRQLKNTSAIVMGASAGAMNMSAKWLSSIHTNQEVTTSSIVNGVGLDHFYFCTKANQTLHDKCLFDELLPMSNDLPIYVAIEEVAIRVTTKQIEVSGVVYLLENEQISKVQSTF